MQGTGEGNAGGGDTWRNAGGGDRWRIQVEETGGNVEVVEVEEISVWNLEVQDR